jgi:SH3-like domain-containing protein
LKNAGFETSNTAADLKRPERKECIMRKSKAMWMAMFACCWRLSVGADAAQPTMSVQVQNGQLRAAPSFLAASVASVQYGDAVTVLEEQSGWMKVQGPGGKEGWIHNSALTRKRVILRADGKDAPTGASADELALAGKGFNSDVEAQFKAENKDVDFTWVDRMEKIKIDPKEIREFLAQGKVEPAKGGQP